MAAQIEMVGEALEIGFQYERQYESASRYAACIQEYFACRIEVEIVRRIDIEKSEFLSDMLTKAGVPHNVLNARQHEKEAQIVADAGKPGAVTIATNMAGRGTDIVLGGSLDAALAEADSEAASSS